MFVLPAAVIVTVALSMLLLLPHNGTHGLPLSSVLQLDYMMANEQV